MESKCRREYRKYTPWIYFATEVAIVTAILFSINFITPIGILGGVVFIGFLIWSTSKLKRVLKRQKEYKNMWFLD